MNVVVTGGGTIAPIDEVRNITNASTGRFSARITEACLARGADVWHVHTPTAELPFERSARMDLRDNPDEELARLAALRKQWRACRERLHLYPLPTGTVAEYSRSLHAVLHLNTIDVAFLAMAVSDFEPEPTAGKIASGDGSMTLALRPTPKVIRNVKDWAPDVFLVGFKLLVDVDDAELIRRAEAACEVNRADATVANDFRTVREGRHRIVLVHPGDPPEAFGPETGDDVAETLVDRVFDLVRARVSAREPIELDPLE